MENLNTDPRPNSWFLIAAVVMAATTLIHIFVGGPEVYVPLRQSAMDDLVVSVMSVVWHAISVLLAIMAVGLAWLWRNQNPAMAWFIAAIQIGFAVLFLCYGWIDLGTLWPMPQWIIFLVGPLLILCGLRRAR
mgnify:CR=1 FL=1